MVGVTEQSAVTRDENAARAHLTLRWRLDYFIFAWSVFSIFYIEMRGTNEVARLGSLSLKIIDPISAALMVLVVLVVLSRRLPPALVTLYFALYAFVFLRGFAVSPLMANDGLRRDAVFLALLLSVTTGGWHRLGTARVVRIFTVAAMAISILSLLRHVLGNDLFVTAAWDDQGFRVFNDGRTLGAVAVILLSVTIVIRLTREQIEQPGTVWKFHWDWTTLFFFLVILASGQRTASIGLALAMTVVLCNRLRLSMHLVALIAIVGGLIVTFIPLEFNADLVESGFEGKSGTFAYRTLIWAGFFNQLNTAPVIEVLFGRPLGDFADFYVGNTLWTGSLHSAYVGSISLVGYAGLVVLLLIAGRGTIMAYLNYVTYKRPPGLFTPEIKLMFAAIVLIFGFSYEWRELSGLMFGVLATNLPRTIPESERSAQEVAGAPMAETVDA